MPFQKMTIDDIPVIAPYFRFVTTNTCDFTVGGMFMWRDYFHMAWQVEDGVLYSTLTGEDGNLYYNLPLGEDIPAGLRQCLTRHPERPVRFCTIPEADLPLFRELPGRVEITEEENFADYLYSAEEMIQLAFREDLRKKGIIQYMGGKVEFMARGMLDGVDIAMMVHGGAAGPEEAFDFSGGLGMNGCMAKTIRYKGKSSHAGGAPHLGINAQYAAMLGLQACNDLRETFQEKDTIRFHPIMMGVNCAVNIIPDEMKIESYVRGRTLEAIKRENIKVNRALTGAALAMGAGVELCDRPGYAPEYHDPAFMKLVEECCCDLVGEDRVKFDYESWSTGSSDFGDVTCVMPGVQFFAAGAVGTGHGIDYYVKDPNRMCVNAVKAQLFVADALLRDDAAAARKIIADYKPQYPSIRAYLDAINELILDKDAVRYDEHGNAIVDFQN